MVQRKMTLSFLVLFSSTFMLCAASFNIEEAVLEAVMEVNLRRHGKINHYPSSNLSGPGSPFSIRATIGRRRESPEIVAALGYSADVVETALSLFTTKNGGKFPDPNIFRKFIAPYCYQRTIICDPNSVYREADGSCNNLRHVEWGASFTPFARFLSPEYSDIYNIGVIPRIKSVTGRLLPSPRIISNAVNSVRMSQPTDPIYNILLIHFGEVLVLETTATPLLQDGSNNIACCHGDKPIKRFECFPFFTPLGDFQTTCQTFVRSESAPALGCTPGPRNQMNLKTSYLDLSAIYGNTKEGLDKIRRFGTGNADNFDSVFTAFHVVFLRENENIVRGLRNLGWHGESLYDEARKIVTGMYQHAVYTEYLPAVLGKEGMKMFRLFSTKFGYNTQYDPNIDASTRSSFSAAAFRFTHSALESIEDDLLGIFSPDTVTNYIDAISNSSSTKRLLCQHAGRTDRFFSDYARNRLFETMPGNGFDNSALDIQRGRDHGLPSYNKWRKFCGLRPVLNLKYGAMGFTDHDPSAAKALSSVYSHPDDIDLFAGGISERPASGAIVGPTFRCIIGLQFSAYKFGDRFFYENDFYRTGFTKGQLKEIKQQSLSALFCRNMDIDAIPRNIFVSPKSGEPLVPCSAFPKLDLRKWRKIK